MYSENSFVYQRSMKFYYFSENCIMIIHSPNTSTKVRNFLVKYSLVFLKEDEVCNNHNIFVKIRSISV